MNTLIVVVVVAVLVCASGCRGASGKRRSITEVLPR